MRRPVFGTAWSLTVLRCAETICFSPRGRSASSTLLLKGYFFQGQDRFVKARTLLAKFGDYFQYFHTRIPSLLVERKIELSYPGKSTKGNTNSTALGRLRHGIFDMAYKTHYFSRNSGMTKLYAV